MGSHPIFKSVDEYSQHTFKVYKTWTFTESTIGQYGSSVNEAVYVLPSATDTFGSNASGLSKRSLFDMVYSTYYRYPKNPFNAQGGNSAFQDRDISNRAIIVSIGNDYIGESIKPGSIVIGDNSAGNITILDDGFGNLYNSSDSTTYVPSSSAVGYWSFNEGFVTSGTLAPLFENNNHVYGKPSAFANNVTYTSGIFGSKINFSGLSQSFAIIDDYRSINFRTTEDFAVSLWVWIPPSQSMTPVQDNSILEKWDCNGGYPFTIRVFNQTATTSADRGKLFCNSWDTVTGVYIASTNSLNNGIPHHIVYQRSGNVYTLYVDGVSNGTVTANLQQTHNNSPLYVGARGYAGALAGTIYNFSGSVDELRIYNRSLTTAEISVLYSKPSNTNVIGNAFYSHGILALTNLSGSYANLMLAGSSFSMNYKSTVSITENNVLATVVPNEFNMTNNPSAATVYSSTDMSYLPIVTGSDWSPYITTLGMYDDNLNLIAVAKFAKPIKKPTDAPITFAIRWDS